LKEFSKYFGKVAYCQKSWVAPKASGAFKVHGVFGNYRTKTVCAAAEIAGLKYEFANHTF